MRQIYQVMDGEKIVMEGNADEVAKQLHVHKSVIYNSYTLGITVKGFRMKKIEYHSEKKQKDGIPDSKWREWDEMCARSNIGGGKQV